MRHLSKIEGSHNINIFSLFYIDQSSAKVTMPQSRSRFVEISLNFF